MNKIFVNQLNVGENITDFFALRKLEIKDYVKGERLALELGDKTGRVNAVCWDNARMFFSQLEKGKIVKIKGKVGSYNDTLQITISKIRLAKEDEYDISDFLPTSEKDLEELLIYLKQLYNAFNNPHLKALLDLIFSDDEFIKKFSKAPGGKLWHHSFIGGLLEHTCNVTRICEQAAEQYEYVDRELLLTGAILHDIGKIYEFNYDSVVIDYSDIGRLVGHIVIGDSILLEYLSKLSDFPSILKLRLRHLLVSHHNEKENGSPVVPQTLEANILAYADNLDAQTSGLLNRVKKDKGQGQEWTGYVNLLNRFVFIGPELAKAEDNQ